MKRTALIVTLALLLASIFAGWCAAQILPPALRAALPAAYAAGSPHARYAEWSLTADPAWHRAPHRLYLAWLTTHNPERLAEAIAFSPRESYPDDMPGHWRNALRQEGVYTAVMAGLLRPHMSEDRWAAVWRPRLIIMGQRMLDHARVGDLDECCGYLATWMLLDRILGTTFMQAERGPPPGEPYHVGVNTPAEVRAYLEQIFAADQIDGGMFDASSAYHLNTAGIWLLGGVALGPDALPGFRNWLPELRNYLLRSVAYDLSFAQAHGDQEGGETLHLPFRLNCMWSVIGLGADPDGQLAALAAALKPATEPQHLYPAGDAWAFLFTDPRLFEVRPRGPPQGLHVARGAGLAMFQGERQSVFAHLLTLKNDDHAYVGSWLDVVWRLEGNQVLDRPGGYSIGGNEWWNHNGVALKGDGWLWPRRFIGGDVTPRGFRARGETWGPSNHYNHALGIAGSATDYDRCRLTTQVELDGKALTIGHDWTTPGDTFPSWSAESPVIQQVIHSRNAMRAITRGVEWTAGPKRIRATSPDADAVSFAATGQGWQRAIFASNKVIGRMAVTVAVEDIPQRPASREGTKVPPAMEIVDSMGATWMLAAGKVLRGGKDTGGSGSVLSYRAGVVSTLGTDNRWWSWRDGWIAAGDTEPNVPPTLPTPAETPGQILARHLRAAAEELEAIK